jgi:DNA-binding NtrC family response regulator
MGSLPQPELQERLSAILAICQEMNSERKLGHLLDLIEDLYHRIREEIPLLAELDHPAPAGKPKNLKLATQELEREMIAQALAHTANNQQRAARLLGLSRQGLINKLKRYGLG